MEDGLHKLKEIGAQKIHKDTHISKDFVQAIIHGSFDGLNSVQLTGFISILEREYSVDLSELKRKSKEYFDEIERNTEELQKVFITPKKKKKSSQVYVWLALVALLSVAYYSFVYLSSMATNEQKIDNSNIKNAQETIAQKPSTEDIAKDVSVKETNETKVLKASQNVAVETQTVEDNTTKIIIETEVTEPIVEKSKETIKTLKILPKNKIWAGYIDIKTNQKYQKIFTKEFAIDVSKNWLLLFGSGTVHLEVNGKKETFSSRQNMRFKYVDGVLTKITVAEFKSMNKGRKW